MASTGSSRTTQGNLLRIRYQDKMRRQFSTKSLLLQAMARNSKNYAEGEKISIPMHAAGGEGPTWSSAGILPPASVEQVERATFNYMSLLDQIEVRGDFEAAARDAGSSEKSPIDFQTRSLVRRGRHDLNFELYGDGTAILANPLSAASATQITVDSISGLRNNQRVDILLTANGAVGAGGVSGAQIKVNRSTKVVTLQGTSQLADGSGAELTANYGDYAMYRSGARNDACFGLAAAISATNTPTGVLNYGNVDRTDDNYDFYRAVDHGNGGVPRAVTMKIMQDVLDEVDAYSEGDINLILTHPLIWNGLVEKMEVDRRYKGEATVLNGWANAVKMASVKAPIAKDPHCPPDRMYFLDTSTWTLYQDDEGHWAYQKATGAIWFPVPGKVAVAAAWERRLQPVCDSPIANGVLRDLSYVAAA
jgi:hypothetical protein